MAETFEAIRRGPFGFEQRVCIKRILPAYESDTGFIDAFLREAKTSAGLRHGNIVQVLDFGVADGTHYLALELIDGVDLRALLKNDKAGKRTLDADLLTLVASDLALALSYAHRGDAQRASVVHRDLSPSNVLVSRAGELKLSDFGIAKAVGAQPLTTSGMIKGKIPYLPPEYLEKGDFGPEGDLFALGVMLFELWTGTRPFDGENEIDTIRRICAGTRARIDSIREDTPRELAHAIEHLLEKDPAARTRTADELLRELPVISVPLARQKLSALVSERVAQKEPSLPESEDVALQRTELAHDLAPAHSQDLTRTAPLQTHGPRARSRLAILVLMAVVSASAVLFAWLSHDPARDVRVSAPRSPSSVPARPRTNDAHLSAAPPEPPATPKPETADQADDDTELAELRVVVIPFGEVWIDGRRQGIAPVTAKLSPGSHDVGAGDVRPLQSKTLSLHKGERQKLVFQLDSVAR